MRRALNQIVDFGTALEAVFVVGFDLQTLLVRFDRLVVLLEHLMAHGFPDPGLDELRVDFYGLIGVFEPVVRLSKLDVAHGPICVQRLIGRIATNALLVLLDGLWELLLLEELASETLVFLRNVRVDVSLGLGFSLLLFEVLHGHFDRVVVVFKQSLAVGVESDLELTVLLVGGRLASQDLGQLHVVVVLALCALLSLFAGADGLSKLLLFNVASRDIRIKKKLVRVELNSRVVALKCLLEIFLLVKAVAFEFLGLGIANFLQFHLLLVRHGGLLSRLPLGCLLGLTLGLGFSCSLTSFFVLLLALGLLGLHVT